MITDLHVNDILIDDSFIKSFFVKNDKLCPGRTCWLTSSTNELYIKCKLYLENRFEGTNDYREALYRIVYDYIEEPKCPVCGKNIKIINNPAYHYNTYCSVECRAKDKELINKSVKKMKSTLWEKYKVTAAAQLPTNVFKTNHPMKKEETRKRVSKKLKEYNKHVSQETREKIEEKRISTSMSRYNVANPAQAPEIKEKIITRTKEETRKKYGVDSVFSIPSIRKKAEDTRYKNNHGPKSDLETKSYKKVAKVFTDAVRHWNKDERYPFRCDIYIPSLDVFIECQYFKTHGGHPYDANNEDDVKLAEELKHDKSAHFDYKTFTERDVKKREYARKNNLTFFEIWNYSEVMPLIYKLKELQNELSEEIRNKRIEEFKIKKARADEEYEKTSYCKQKRAKQKKKEAAA